MKKAAQDKSQDEEKREAAQSAYQKWLDEKEALMKEERKMERIRLADEAQSYVIRDRDMCEKAFRK